MTRQLWAWPLIAAGALGIAISADELPAQQRQAIDRGLEWLAKAQAGDGHWGPEGRQHSTSLTARAGLVLLMQGSTLRQGKYSDHLRKAVKWLVKNSQASGLLCNTNDNDSVEGLGFPVPAGRRLGRGAGAAKDYMEGHGFAMLFLASVCRQEEDGDRRQQLKDVLTRAVDFCGKAQTELGGWGYVSAREGGNWDVGDLAVVQMQGLRACQDAGIAGTRPILTKALKYLEQCTTRNGGVVFCLATGGRGGERPNLTAAALVGSFSAGQYDSDLVKKWLKYCTNYLTIGNGALSDPDGYDCYYYAQALHMLGDDGFERLFPASRPEERVTWSKYKKHGVEPLIASQGKDGSWDRRNNKLLLTTVNLTILQLDATSLPIYRRAATKAGAARGSQN
jgi:hypothetical protein